MERVDIYFNGSTLTGITIDENGLAAIMTPPSMKSGVSNASRLINGREEITTAGNYKYETRTFNLTINCVGATETEFLNNYQGLCNILALGRFGLKTDVTSEIDVIYESCSQFTQYQRGIGKFTLRLTELQPSQTIVTRS